MNCDVFISYRRDGGDMAAMHVYQALQDRGYSVFYDLEVLRAGKFNEALLDSIDSCQDFVLILSPHALDRCVDEDDWVRMEIAEALRKKKNIVPIIMNGFQFPKTLPEEIREVQFQNGLTATTEYFSESMDRLASRYLVSRPDPKNGKKGKAGPSHRKGIIIGAVCGLAALAAAVFLIFGNQKRDFPDQIGSQPEGIQQETEISGLVEGRKEQEPGEDPGMARQDEPAEIADVSAQAKENLLGGSGGAQQENGVLPVLKRDDPQGLTSDQIAELPAFGGSLKRSEIGRIVFTSAEPEEGAWDVSEAGDGSVMAWTAEVGSRVTLFISAGGRIRMPEDMSGTFQSYTGADALEWNGLADFSGVVTATNCFSFSSFETLDFEGADFSALESADGMFQRCESLRELNLTGASMDHLTRTAWMFDGCTALTKLDVSGLDVSRVREMTSMFQDCASLTELDLHGFRTDRAIDLSAMFEGCRKLEKLNLTGWNTARVSDMQRMFNACEKLEEVDLSGFQTGEVVFMNQMFSGCRNLISLDVSGFDTGKVTRMDLLFEGCEQLDTLDVSGWNTSSVTSMRQMFCACFYIQRLDVSGFDTSSVTDLSMMFCNMSHLRSLDVSRFQTGRTEDFTEMFSGCALLTSLDVSGFDLSSAKRMTGMFRDCVALENIGTDPASFGRGDTADLYLNTPLAAGV